MSDLNTIVVIGRLTQDSQNINSQKGGLRFSIANNGFKPEDTTYFNCTWFGERAAKSGYWLTKGKQVAVTGRMTSQKVNDKVYWSIIVSDLMPTGSRAENSGDSSPESHLGAEMAFQGYSDEQIKAKLNDSFEESTKDFEEEVRDMFSSNDSPDIPF